MFGCVDRFSLGGAYTLGRLEVSHKLNNVCVDDIDVFSMPCPDYYKNKEDKFFNAYRAGAFMKLAEVAEGRLGE